MNKLDRYNTTYEKFMQFREVSHSRQEEARFVWGLEGGYEPGLGDPVCLWGLGLGLGGAADGLGYFYMSMLGRYPYRLI